MPRSSVSRRSFLSPSDLARRFKLSPRTIREYCKQGKIPEAIPTRGGHWRIRLPLSGKTLAFLGLHRADWPAEWRWEGESVGEFDVDSAAVVMTAQLLKCSVDDLMTDPGLTERCPPEVADKIAEMERGIYKATAEGRTFPQLLLVQGVYQFWRDQHRAPNRVELASVMNMSRSTFYRRGHHKIFRDLVYAVTGEMFNNLRGTSGTMPEEYVEPDMQVSLREGAPPCSL